jgi:cell division protein FtsL
MILAVFAMRVLEVLFFTGLVGSAVVVVISFVEDGKELFGENDSEERPHPNS